MTISRSINNTLFIVQLVNTDLLIFKGKVGIDMKQKILKKMGAMLIVGTVLLSSTSVVFAGQAQGTSAGRTFSKSWKAEAKSGNGSVTFGYNTDWINEDFAWGYCSDASHSAALRNGRGWHYGPTKSRGDVSKIEVQHSHNGTDIKYQCNW